MNTKKTLTSTQYDIYVKTRSKTSCLHFSCFSFFLGAIEAVVVNLLVTCMPPGCCELTPAPPPLLCPRPLAPLSRGMAWFYQQKAIRQANEAAAAKAEAARASANDLGDAATAAAAAAAAGGSDTVGSGGNTEMPSATIGGNFFPVASTAIGVSAGSFFGPSVGVGPGPHGPEQGVFRAVAGMTAPFDSVDVAPGMGVGGGVGGRVAAPRYTPKEELYPPSLLDEEYEGPSAPAFSPAEAGMANENIVIPSDVAAYAIANVRTQRPMEVGGNIQDLHELLMANELDRGEVPEMYQAESDEDDFASFVKGSSNGAEEEDEGFRSLAAQLLR